MKAILSILFASFCSVLLVQAQSSCPSLSISTSLRTSWVSQGEQYNLYDITATNNYATSVSNIILLIQASTSASLNVSQTWNLIELPSSYENKIPFTLVVAGSTSALVIDAGQSWTGSGFVVMGDTASVSTSVTCTGSGSSSPSSSSSSSSSESPASSSSSSSDSSLCTVQMMFSLLDESSPTPTWQDANYQYTQFSFRVTNNGDKVATSASVAIAYDTTFGTIDQSWNMQVSEMLSYGAVFQVQLYGLAPGQTFQSAGMIFKVSLDTLANTHVGHYSYPYTFYTLATSCN